MSGVLLEYRHSCVSIFLDLLIRKTLRHPQVQAGGKIIQECAAGTPPDSMPVISGPDRIFEISCVSNNDEIAVSYIDQREFQFIDVRTKRRRHYAIFRPSISSIDQSQRTSRKLRPLSITVRILQLVLTGP